MFCNFCAKIRKFKMAAIFCEKIFLKIGITIPQRYPAGQKFFGNWHGYSAEIPCGSKISSKSLYLARFSRYKHFHVCNLRKNSKIQNGRHFLQENFFENWDNYSAEIPCGSKISSKSLYLAWFSRYKHFCVFLIWKIHND